MEVVEERRLVREKVISEVSGWERSLPFKCTVALVGSYARGDFSLWSDVDVFIVSSEFKGGLLDRLRIEDGGCTSWVPGHTSNLGRV